MRASALRAALAGAAVAACLGCAGAPAAGPEPPSSRIPPGAKYVALGSSFASGLGLPPIVDEGCERSGGNYARKVADALRLDLTDVTCFGARTEHIEYAPQDAGGTRPPQVDSLTADTALVTLTVGGNDVGYTRMVGDQACSTRSECAGIAPDEEGVRRALETIADKLVGTLYTITTRAPRATVLLVTYPQIVPSSGETCEAIALSAEQARFSATAGQRLDQAFRDAAARSGVQLVDSYPASEGHSACSPEPWVSGHVPSTAASGAAAFHPTVAGMRAQAELIIAALPR
jgi:hypothetical protein